MAKKIDVNGLDHYHDKVTASFAMSEASSTASAAHKAGEYFYFKGELVECTADIAQGGTITLNTNCKSAKLANDVCDLKTALTSEMLETNSAGLFCLTSHGIINSSGLWKTITATGRHVIIPVNQGDIVKMTAKSDQSAYYALLVSYNIAHDVRADFVSGTGRTAISSGTTATVTIPENCKYLYLLYCNSPSTAVLYPDSIIINGTVITADVRKGIADNNDAIADLELKEYGAKFLSASGIINSSGKWKITGAGKSISIPVTVGDVVTIKANPNEKAYYAFLVSDNRTQDALADYVSGTSRVAIEKNAETTVTVPDTCNYLYVLDYNTNTPSAYPTKLIINGIDYAFDERTETMQLMEDVRHSSLLYASGSFASGDATEKIDIYLPVTSGYLLYRMLHFIDDTNNSNCWQMYHIYHVTDNFALETDLTRTGEYECAVRMDGRDDYSGGHTHGDEILVATTFLVDGIPVDITQFTALTDFSEFTVIRTSKLYDPADHTTEIAEHGVEYNFSKTGLVINQSLKWLVAETLEHCYLAMFLPSKAYIDRAVANSDFEVITLPSDTSTPLTSVTKNGANAVTMWDTESGFSAKVSVPVYPTGLTLGDRVMISDSGGNAYNKVYFVVCNGGSSTIGELWKSTAVYNLDYKATT